MAKIPHWLMKQAYLSPDQPAIEMDDNFVITFSELDRKSKRYAKQLASLNIKKNSHVALFSSNDPQMIVIIHALSYLGAVIVMLNTRLTKHELNYQLKDAEVSHLLVSDDLYEQVLPMGLFPKTYTFSQIKKMPYRNISLKKEINLSDPFTIMYTSGTTGNPKGVVHSYGNHWWSAINSALNLGLSKDDRWLTVLPMFHVGGFSICMRSVIYGIPLYLYKKFDAEKVNETIMTKRITIASVVTVMLENIVTHLNNKRYPNYFRCMLLGGGPCPVDLLEKAQDHNIAVFQSYGMTETSSQIVTLSARDALRKLGASGKPLMSAELKINEPDADGIGEIFVKGPMVTNGYFKNNSANKSAFHNGWLATGDLGYLDDEKFLYVVDRRTDLIISGGENIYPTEIEHQLGGMEGIKEIAIVGMKDEQWGEVPVAFIVKNDPQLTVQNVRTYAKKYLARYKVPKHYYFIDELPRNASNKVMRHKLVKKLTTIKKGEQNE